jgi:hypothetical protein
MSHVLWQENANAMSERTINDTRHRQPCDTLTHLSVSDWGKIESTDWCDSQTESNMTHSWLGVKQTANGGGGRGPDGALLFLLHAAIIEFEEGKVGLTSGRLLRLGSADVVA